MSPPSTRRQEKGCTLEPHSHWEASTLPRDTHKFTHASHKYAWAESAETGTLQSRAPRAAPPRRPWGAAAPAPWRRRGHRHAARAARGTRRGRAARCRVRRLKKREVLTQQPPATHVSAGRGGNEPAVPARVRAPGEVRPRVSGVCHAYSTCTCVAPVSCPVSSSTLIFYGVG